MEILHVKLPNKAAEIIVLKVLRKHILSKMVRVFYDKTVPRSFQKIVS